DPLVDINHVVDQRELEIQPRFGDHTHRLAEPDHQRKSRLVDGEQRGVADDRRDDGEYGEHAACNAEFHRVPPVVPVSGARRSSSLSGRIGTTPPALPPLPWPAESRSILSVPPN